MSRERGELFAGKKKGVEGVGRMVNSVPCDPLVSACRQCLAGQRILEAQGEKNASGFLPFVLLSGQVLDSTIWGGSFQDRRPCLQGSTGGLFAVTAFWPIPPALGSTTPSIRLDGDGRLEVCTLIGPSSSTFSFNKKKNPLFKEEDNQRKSEESTCKGRYLQRSPHSPWSIFRPPTYCKGSSGAFRNVLQGLI